MTATPTKAFGYARVSTEEQATHGSSLAAQEARIRATCEAKGWDLVKVFVDRGVSGSLPLGVRPAGRQLLAALEAGAVVVAIKLDRLFRSTVDAVTTAEAWREAEVDMAIDGVDTTTSIGRAMFSITAALAELEKERTRERTLATLEHRKNRGLRVGQIPMGAKLAADGQTLVAEPAELTVLQRISELRDQGFSFRQIADHLTKIGAPRKNATGPWTKGAVHHLFHASN